MLFTMVELINILLCIREKITLFPLTSNKIVQYDRAIADMAKREYKIQHDQKTPHSSSNAIKLKSRTIFANRSDLFISTTVDAPYHALVYRQVLFSLDDIATPLSRTITILLQEFKDIFPVEIPPRLPPLREIEY
jgi:hypothetical protein